MKFIKIDMSTQRIVVEESPLKYKDLGGRGLTSTLLADEVNPLCYPLGKDNKIIIAPGLLTGTKAPCSARTSVGAKSPLTGGIKESNVGGIAGQHLAAHKIKALVIEGKPLEKHLWVLIINGDEIALEIKNELAGLGNYEVVDRMRTEYGSKVAVISTGPAGEMGAALATLAVGDIEGRPVRHAARGGMGAVMGSKGIKAIVILPHSNPIIKPANPQQFDEKVQAFAKSTMVAKKHLTTYGSAVLVNVINELGGIPNRNFARGRNENVAKISGERLHELCHERGGSTGHACSRGCVIRCSNVFHDKQGEYVTGGMEYETIALLGSNCEIDDLDDIAQLDRLCDDFGIDTIEMGVTLGVAMEGGLLPFGDFEKMKKAIISVADGKDFGKVLGQGAAVTGRVLGVERVPVVKGQSMAAYDPRALKGMGVTYATSPMGADHTSGPCMPGRDRVNPSESSGQIALSMDQQRFALIVDMLGLCLFVGAGEENLPIFSSLMSAFVGREVSSEMLVKQAGNILNLESEFNRRAGISQVQNDVPLFFRTEPLPNDAFSFDVPTEELIDLKYC